MLLSLATTHAALAPLTLTLLHSLEAIVRECHKPAQRPPDPASAIIYCVAFCDIAEAYNSYFATARSNCLSLYQVVRSSNKGKEEDATQLCKCFIDEDKAEVYYTACFGITDGNKPVSEYNMYLSSRASSSHLSSILPDSASLQQARRASSKGTAASTTASR